MNTNDESAGSSAEVCPTCGAPEVDANTPRTVYACGSSDYDQRPGTFIQKCSDPIPSLASDPMVVEFQIDTSESGQLKAEAVGLHQQLVEKQKWIAAITQDLAKVCAEARDLERRLALAERERDEALAGTLRIIAAPAELSGDLAEMAKRQERLRAERDEARAALRIAVNETAQVLGFLKVRLANGQRVETWHDRTVEVLGILKQALQPQAAPGDNAETI